MAWRSRRACARIADPPADARLLDPFCGTGTIAIEAKLARPDLAVAASDLDPRAVAAARRNAIAAGVDVTPTVCDACDALPATLIVTNPPWGRAVILLADGHLPPAGATVLDRRWLRVAGRPAVCWTVEPPG